LEIKIGEQYIKSFIISIEMVDGFALSTGDTNPVHMDDSFAKTTVFKKRIAHGFLVGSLISTVLGNYYPGYGTIYMSQYIKFRRPVFINDQVKVIIEAVEMTKTNWLKLKTTCRNQNEILVMEGEALVIPPEDCKILL
jgi:3-hydroxybutyryl-CoA dehydratase